MVMEFHYSVITGQRYSHFSGEWYYEERDVHYVPDEDDLVNEIAELIYTCDFCVPNVDEATKKAIVRSIGDFVVENDLVGKFFEKYKDDLEEVFRERAIANEDY